MSDCSSSSTIFCAARRARCRCDLHAWRRDAAAGRRQHALAVDLDHAGAAVADGFQAFLVAQARDLDAFAVGDFDQGFVRAAAIA
jgi:hypothetical protein